MSCYENGDTFLGILDSFIVGTCQKLCPAFTRLRDGRMKVTTDNKKRRRNAPAFQIQLFVQDRSRSTIHRPQTARITMAMQTAKGQRDLTATSK